MGLSKEEIVELACRYLPESEIRRFVLPGEVFCFLHRIFRQDRGSEDDTAWELLSYGICKEYTYDESVKLRGKWLLFTYVSLGTFPPTEHTLQLQPPHIVKGYFQTPDRSTEIRIMTISSLMNRSVPNSELQASAAMDANDSDKLIPFPAPKKGQ
ncbi:MAG: hypothetical protein JW795_17175 [Chitinivibrionales bacterium]|nr:hypothetical protein [Chitinivibrionales bacterium]